MKRLRFGLFSVFGIFLSISLYLGENWAIARPAKLGDSQTNAEFNQNQEQRGNSWTIAQDPCRVRNADQTIDIDVELEHPICVSPEPDNSQTIPEEENQSPAPASTEGEASETESESEMPEGSEDLAPFEEVVKDFEKLEGLFTLYRQPDKNTVYLEVKPEQLNRNFLMVATLSSGLGEWGLYQGMPIRDFVFQLRQIQKTRVDLVVPNTRFRAQAGDVHERAIDRSFSDSVIYSLAVKSIHPERNTLLIDISEMLMADIAGMTSAFPWILSDTYAINPGTSSVGSVQTFPLNVEIDWIYGFAGGGNPWLAPATLADSRGFYLTVRYSLSELPVNNGYRPRLADDRVGHFLSAYQDLSRQYDQDPFVRYIKRWNLQKQDPYAPLSPPTEPIVFWIENTIPVEYRDAVREGILMWNPAFKKIGFINAIEVRQMPDDATWDPADVRYNTIRWFNSLDGGFALGPARANPLTGEILDADVLVSANIIRVMEREYRSLTQNSLNPEISRLASNSLLCNPGLKLPNFATGRFFSNSIATEHPLFDRLLATSQLMMQQHHFCFALGSARQAAFGALSLSLRQNLGVDSEEKKIYIHQFLRHLVAHEVGHTLGLRHNFKGSNLLMPEELNNLEITREKGLVSSVMDYVPVNLAAPGEIQGDYFSTQVGAYDEWAIEYAYKPIAAMTPEGEIPELERIAQRAPEPELSYATDEDAWGAIDPTALPWDLSADPLGYAQIQLENARYAWENLDTDYLRPSESYPDLRDAFNLIFGYYIGYAMNATTYIGGQRFSRNHPDDPGASLPFEKVSVEQQREALQLLNKYVFAENAFNFDPELINQLAPSRWFHWGSYLELFRLDYPIYQRISLVQGLMLSNLFASDRLERLRDAELTSTSSDMFTMSELFTTLKAEIWSEAIEPDDESLEISTVRRGLQRFHLNILVNMVLRNPQRLMNSVNFLDFLMGLQTLNAPEDARVLARYQLRELSEQIEKTLKRHHKKMDTSTKAHLEDALDRIFKTLSAPIPAN